MEHRSAYGALLVVQVLFGVLPVAGKLAFDAMTPWHLLALRTGAAALILAALYPFLVRRPVPRKDLPWVAVLALFGVVLNQALFLLGLQRTSPINANLVITTIPVFTYAIAVALGRETLGPRRALGIGLALAGIVYLVGLSGVRLGWEHALGDLLVALNSFSFALFLVLSRDLARRVDGIALTTWMFVFAGLVVVPIGLLAGLPSVAVAFDGTTWGVVAFIVLGPTVVTYVLNAFALGRVPSSTVAVFIYLQPVFTALASWLVLDQPPSWRIVPAAAAVFAGLYLVAVRRRTVSTVASATSPS